MLFVVIGVMVAACGGDGESADDTANNTQSSGNDTTTLVTVQDDADSTTNSADTVSQQQTNDNDDEDPLNEDAQAIATITGELSMLDNDSVAEVFVLNDTVLLSGTLEYLNTSRDNVHRFSLDFDPVDGNGWFSENDRFRLMTVEFSYDYDEEDTVEYRYPDDREDAFFSYSLSTVTNRQASFDPTDWDDVTGILSVTPDDMQASGEINLTIPIIDDTNDEPAGEITLDITFTDIAVENPEEYQVELDRIERERELRQAMADAVSLTISGAFDLSIPPAGVLYYSSSQFRLSISEPDVVMVQLRFNQDITPGTYTPEASCNRFTWTTTCLTLTQYLPDGNYIEYSENITGDLTLETLIPLRATLNVTAEDMAGNAITVTGEFSDVPFPLDD